MSALQTEVRRCEDAYDKGDCEGQRSVCGYRFKYYNEKGKVSEETRIRVQKIIAVTVMEILYSGRFKS